MAIIIPKKQLSSIIKKNEPKNKFWTKKSKYNNTKIKEFGFVFDSKNEYNRYCFLLKMERAGLISSLRYHQKTDEILLQKHPQIKYIPDFCYTENDFFVIEDFKGYQTKEFKIKKKLLIGLLNSSEIKTNTKLRLVSKKNNSFKVIEEYVFFVQKT
jgi:hypothetical protein